MVYEIGMSDQETALTNDDVIRKINTKLLAGDAPDVLFLDGLSIDSLHKQELLSDITLDLDQSQYYEKILNSYTDNGVAYAYPAFFKVPVFITADATLDMEKQNTLENIAKLYQNPDNIYSDWYPDIFNCLYYGTHQQLFPDHQSVNEVAVKELLLQTKLIVDSQPMMADTNYRGMTNHGSYDVKWENTPSIDALAGDKENEKYGLAGGKLNATEVLYNHNAYIFKSNENIRILPLINKNYINPLIASVPVNAKNKEMADQFIKILLSQDEIQSFSFEGFPVKKRMVLPVQEEKYNKITDEERDGLKFIENFLNFDWDGLLDSLDYACHKDTLVYDIIYDQAKEVYEDNIDVDSAVNNIMQRLNLLFAEKSS